MTSCVGWELSNYIAAPTKCSCHVYFLTKEEFSYFYEEKKMISA